MQGGEQEQACKKEVYVGHYPSLPTRRRREGSLSTHERKTVCCSTLQYPHPQDRPPVPSAALRVGLGARAARKSGLRNTGPKPTAASEPSRKPHKVPIAALGSFRPAQTDVDVREDTDGPHQLAPQSLGLV